MCKILTLSVAVGVQTRRTSSGVVILIELLKRKERREERGERREERGERNIE